MNPGFTSEDIYPSITTQADLHDRVNVSGILISIMTCQKTEMKQPSTHDPVDDTVWKLVISS
jgi:hypothetical protein